MTSGNIVKLNVGGTIFQTTRSTLTYNKPAFRNEESLFKKMLESKVPVELDSDGCIFIDRDPTHFRFILNFMRDGSVELPENLKDVKEILKEAEFYLLPRLQVLCKQEEQLLLRM